MTTTVGSSGTATVAALYEAFGRGDIPTILGLLDDEVSWDADWQGNTAQDHGVATMQPRRGKAGVVEFFQVLANYTFHDFQVHDLMGSDKHVAALLTVDFTLPSGARVRDEEIHLWTTGADGKITALRHYIDTARHIAAEG